MIGYRCQCGKKIGSSSIGFQECQGCDECGTTYASHPDGHRKKIDHDWAPFYNQRTGKADKRICNRCFTIEPVTEQTQSV